MAAAKELSASVPVVDACAALGLPRASYYRWLSAPEDRISAKDKTPSPRALSCSEREAVLEELNSERFVDQSPAAVYATLLDEDRYLCSIRTMYRILEDAVETRERRNQLTHPQYTKPELLATRPNEVWSWDITKLRGPEKWNHYQLYVMLDIYSRCVVGWLLADRESATLASKLIEEATESQGIKPEELTIHADRGPSMRSKAVGQLLGELGVTKTHSRPHTSNDNPYSEAQFKTLKYRPEFPGRFGSIEDARAFLRGFFHWYNSVHRHSGIALLTPEDVHYGRADELIDKRDAVLRRAQTRNPERFVRGGPRAPRMPTAAWINAPRDSAKGQFGAAQRPWSVSSSPSDSACLSRGIEPGDVAVNRAQ